MHETQGEIEVSRDAEIVSPHYRREALGNEKEPRCSSIVYPIDWSRVAKAAIPRIAEEV
jgi:hypothetical protein